MKVLKIYYEDGGFKNLDELVAVEHLLDTFLDDTEIFLGAKVLALTVKDVADFEKGEILQFDEADED